jgi:hypothetical protein
VSIAWPKKGIPSAGLYAGAAAWGANTQLGYAVVPWACAHDVRIIIPLLALLLATLSVAGGFLSWRALEAVRTAGPPASSLLARLGILSAALSALVKQEVIEPLRQLELELSRHLQETSGRTNLRLRDEGAAPEKYRRAVEEYYRRLSGARPRQ